MKTLIHIVVGIVIGANPVWLCAAEQDPPQIAIGERLFLETRFAQAYYAQPDKSDPALAYTITTRDPLRGAFAGQTMNCRSCHLVDEHGKDVGNRTYADYAHTSPIPERKDEHHFTGRNSMQLVNINPANKSDVLLHFDGEFNSMEDLVQATYTGRNFGWLPDEGDVAIRHIAKILREDDGQGELAREFGGSYTKILTGTAKDIPEQFRLPAQYRIDVKTATDTQLFAAIAKLVSTYVNKLEFQKDSQGRYVGSPYDQFLILNNLPRQPHEDETANVYSQRLLQSIDELKDPKFVTAKNGNFSTHTQAFVFGVAEIHGMKLFLRRGDNKQRGGNCVSCHHAPDFSDFSFHNTGLTQLNYDEVHGQGSFNKLTIPDLKQRNANYNANLPKTAKHPLAREHFRAPVAQEKTGYVDLGMWNIFANPDFPVPQKKLYRHACALAQTHGVKKCSNQTLLPYTIATFKTPVLRDLGHSDPYMHTGQFTNLHETVAFYVTASALAKAGLLRNADMEITRINIANEDVESLVAFLKALNEDYD